MDKYNKKNLIPDFRLLMNYPLTHQSQTVCIWTLGSNNAPETLLLQGTVGFVQMSLSIAVHRAPLTVQHPETVTATEQNKHELKLKKPRSHE